MDAITSQGQFQPPNSILLIPTAAAKPRPVTNLPSEAGRRERQDCAETTAEDPIPFPFSLSVGCFSSSACCPSFLRVLHRNRKCLCTITRH